MLKKILKHTLRTLLVILLVLLLVPALLYVPAVQDLARRRAVAYASRTLGMEVSVERIRLAFPLRLTVDTLLRCGRLSLDAALWPLIRKEVVIRSFALERVAAHYKDTLAGMDLRLAAGELSLEAVRADLSANTAGISRLVLADADIRLNLTEAAPRKRRAPPPCRGRWDSTESRSRASPSGCGPPLRSPNSPSAWPTGASTPAGCCWTASRSP